MYPEQTPQSAARMSDKEYFESLCGKMFDQGLSDQEYASLEKMALENDGFLTIVTEMLLDNAMLSVRGMERQLDLRATRELLSISPAFQQDSLESDPSTKALKTIVSHAESTKPFRFFRRFSQRAALFAAMVLFLLLGLFVGVTLLSPRAPEGAGLPLVGSPSRNPGDVTAQIVRTSGVVWETPAEKFYEWEQVAVGRTLRFLKGSIEVVFSQGVHVILEGPAEMTVSGPLSVDIKQGRVMARVGKEGYGFTVNTPTGRIVDQGTEFGADIVPDKGVKVVVFDGKVDVFPESSPKSMMVSMKQGEALSIGKSGDILPVKMIEAGHFLSSAQHRARDFGIESAKVIVSVTDNIRDAGASKFYEIVHGGFCEDAPAYVDRLHEWNGVDGSGLPKMLLDGDYIRTFNNDRLLKEYQMTVELGAPAQLYVLLDRRSPVPDWLQKGFAKTEMVVGIDENWSRHSESHIAHLKRSTKAKTEEELDALFQTSSSVQRGFGSGNSIDNKFDVWVKLVSKPGKVVLGAIDSGARGNNHYGVVAVPLVGAIE